MRKELVQTPIHISWRLSALALGFLSGAVGSLALSPGALYRVDVLALGICLMLIGLFKKSLVGVFLCLFAGIALGFFRASGELSHYGTWSLYTGSEVRLSGVVEQDPSIDVDGDTQFKLTSVSIDGQNLSGAIWVSTSDTRVIKRSDTVTIEGLLTKGFGTLPAALYRARIVSVVQTSQQDRGLVLRDSFATSVRKVINEPEASLGTGFLLGQKSALPEKLDNELRLLALTHIVVASGYNLTILVRFMRRALHRVSRFTALSGSIGLILLFVSMTGWSPSMTRAAIITVASLLCWYVGRRAHPIVMLLLTAAFTVLIEPSYAWGDVGWLLSFLSFAGVLLLAPLLHAYFFGAAKPGTFRQILLETVSAQVMTVPLVMLLFAQYSPLSLIANLLVVPVIPFAMLLTFVAGLGGFIGGPIAAVLGWLAEWPLAYIISVVDRMALLPLATREISMPMTITLMLYSFIALFTFLLWRTTRLSFRKVSIIE
jgi:competence protein ComEC